MASTAIRGAPSDATLATRVRTLTAVATGYHELTDPGHGAGASDGSGVQLTPHERHCLLLTKLGKGRSCTCAYRTVREFERQMAAMRIDRSPLVPVEIRGSDGHLIRVEKHSVRALRWHLLGWHVNAQRVVRHHPKPVKRGQRLAPAKDERILRDKGGSWVPAVATQTWHHTPGARQVLADAGVRWMAGAWPSWEPELPADYRSKVAA